MSFLGVVNVNLPKGASAKVTFKMLEKVENRKRGCQEKPLLDNPCQNNYRSG